MKSRIREIKYRRLSWLNHAVLLKHNHDKVLQSHEILDIRCVLLREHIIDIRQEHIGLQERRRVQRILGYRQIQSVIQRGGKNYLPILGLYEETLHVARINAVIDQLTNDLAKSRVSAWTLWETKYALMLTTHAHQVCDRRIVASYQDKKSKPNK